MAVTQKAPVGSTIRRRRLRPGVEKEADLVPGVDERPHDPPGQRAPDGRAHEATGTIELDAEPRIPGLTTDAPSRT